MIVFVSLTEDYSLLQKDDIENALRASNMNLEDALEYLNATRAGSNVNNLDGWRRHEIDASPFDHTTNPAFSTHRFNPQQQLPFGVPPVSIFIDHMQAIFLCISGLRLQFEIFCRVEMVAVMERIRLISQTSIQLWYKKFLLISHLLNRLPFNPLIK